jgi:hypothetical protein
MGVDIDVNVGTGFVASEIVNVSELLVPPPGAGFTNVTLTELCAVTSEAGTVAEAFAEVVTVVVRAVAPKYA